jgi:hypothetical protein
LESVGGPFDGWYVQSVINQLQGQIRFFQVGEVLLDTSAALLFGTINLCGQTDIRQLMLFAYYSAGGMGMVTLTQY